MDSRNIMQGSYWSSFTGKLTACALYEGGMHTDESTFSVFSLSSVVNSHDPIIEIVFKQPPTS